MRKFLCSGAALTILAASALALPAPAAAQKLPWTDANPLERVFGKPKAQKRPAQNRPRAQTKRSSAPKAPEVAAVPVPDKRPDLPKNAATGAAAIAAAPLAATAAARATEPKPAEPEAPSAVPTPEPAPPVDAAPAVEPAPVQAEPAKDLPTVPTEAAVPQTAETPKPDIDSEAAAAAISDAAAQPQSTEPLATEPGPGDAIPLPEVRPAESGKASASPTPAAPAAPGAAPAPAPAPAVDPSPNSTEKLKSRTTAISPAASVLAAAAVEDAEICEAELKKRGVDFTVEESISEGECGVLRPISVTKLSSGVEVSPKTQMLCRSALALDDWMTNGVLPAAKVDLPERKLTEFRHASTYVCRPRASEKGISEHARGSAIDIAAFVFDKGEEIGVEAKSPGTPEAKFQDAIRAAACGPFKTVLGPGTDSDHSTHFHLDIAARNNGSTYCK